MVTLFVNIKENKMATYKKWNSQEVDFIRNNYATKDEELAAKLSQLTGDNITVSMVRRQRRKLSLSKRRGRPKKNQVENLAEMQDS
jgi:hypothetical protein